MFLLMFHLFLIPSFRLLSIQVSTLRLLPLNSLLYSQLCPSLPISFLTPSLIMPACLSAFALSFYMPNRPFIHTHTHTLNLLTTQPILHPLLSSTYTYIQRYRISSSGSQTFVRLASKERSTLLSCNEWENEQ